MKEHGTSDELQVMRNTNGIECDVEEGSRTYVRNAKKRGKQAPILKGFNCLPKKVRVSSLRATGSVDTCSSLAFPTEERNSSVAETCHLVRHSTCAWYTVGAY